VKNELVEIDARPSDAITLPEARADLRFRRHLRTTGIALIQKMNEASGTAFEPELTRPCLHLVSGQRGAGASPSGTRASVPDQQGYHHEG